MDACGFDQVAGGLVVSGQLVYADYSAGICVVTPDFEGIHLIDDADVVPPDYPAGAEPRALGWVPWRVVPHWSSDHPEANAASQAVEYLLQAELPFRTLRDGHAIVVDGDATRVTGRS